MTTRKKSGKSKSRRNGRTKRGGFFGIFDDSFSWFSSKNKLDEVKPTSDNKPFDWTFGLKDKLNPPPVPAGQPVRPLQPQPQPQPQAAAAAPEQTSQTASQPASQAAVASQAVPVTPVKGGRRLRVRTKKRRCSCRCKRK